VIAPYNAATVSAITDQRNLNTASQHVQGIDLQSDYSRSVGATSIDLYRNGTYLRTRQQVESSAPIQEVAGTAFYPPRFRARIGTNTAAWGWSAGASLNFTSTFTNLYQPNSSAVYSWTALDMQLAYVRETAGVFHGFRAALSVLNVPDNDPPCRKYDTWSYVGLHHDSLNGSPIGRFVSLQLSKAS
jgi:iron complex outermembrane recepter protein